MEVVQFKTYAVKPNYSDEVSFYETTSMSSALQLFQKEGDLALEAGDLVDVWEVGEHKKFKVVAAIEWEETDE